MTPGMVHDAYNDPYARRRTARLKRVSFEKIKRTPSFAGWRLRQLKIQDGRCAWCRIKLGRQGIIVHVDHVTPLYYEGQNDFANLVLSCRRCNLRKWISNRYVVPQWIKDRDAALKNQQRLRSVRQVQKREAIELLDEMLWDEMREWI